MTGYDSTNSWQSLHRCSQSRGYAPPESPEDCVARGWPIFPCHGIKRGQCTCAKGRDCKDAGKHPLTLTGRRLLRL
jgi:hypothetical protein